MEVEGEFREQISTVGGFEPVWCTECNEVFYRNGDRVYGNRVTLEPTVEFGAAQVVFEADEFIDTPGLSFDVSSNGERMYYVARTAPPLRTKVHVIQNWDHELERVVQVD